jgi:hypothetical protein
MMLCTPRYQSSIAGSVVLRTARSLTNEGLWHDSKYRGISMTANNPMGRRCEQYRFWASSHQL